MESKVKRLLRPIRLRLIGLPLILFLAALIFDIVYLLSQNRAFALVSFVAISAGIVGGLLDAIFGLLRWLALPSKTRAGKMAWVYGTVNLILMLLFTLSWLFRRTSIDLAPSTFVLTLSYAGILLGMLTLWLGGELAYGLDAGGQRRANLNASSSPPSGPRLMRS